MSVLIDRETKLCVSGITGREGTFHAMNNRRYGTNVVSGVTPGPITVTRERSPTPETVGTDGYPRGAFTSGAKL